MKKFLTFPEKDYTAAGSYNEEFHGNVFDTLIIQHDSNFVASGGTITSHAKGAIRPLGTPELNQANNTLIRAQAEDLFLGSAFLNGGFPETLLPASITTGNNDDYTATMRLKFGRIIPGSMVDASVTKCFLRGNFGELTSVATSASGGNVSSATGKLRGAVVTTDRQPKLGFPRPKITAAEVEIGYASSSIPHVIRFEQDTYVRGFAVRAFDDSADADSDGLIRALKVSVTDGAGQNDVVRARWGHLRKQTAALAGWTPEDQARAAGFVWVSMTDETASALNGAKLFQAGDSVTFEFDTSSTAEAGYTAVGAASGDKAVIVTWGATPIDPEGNGGVQVRKIANPKAARRRFRNLQG